MFKKTFSIVVLVAILTVSFASVALADNKLGPVATNGSSLQGGVLPTDSGDTLRDQDRDRDRDRDCTDQLKDQLQDRLRTGKQASAPGDRLRTQDPTSGCDQTPDQTRTGKQASAPGDRLRTQDPTSGCDQTPDQTRDQDRLH